MAIDMLLARGSAAEQIMLEHIEPSLMRKFPGGLLIRSHRTVTLRVRVPGNLVRALRPGDLGRMERLLSTTKGLSVSLRPTFDLLGQKLEVSMRRSH